MRSNLPADPNGDQRFDAGGTSYTLNSFLFVPQLSPFGVPIGGPSNNLLMIKNPADTMLAFIVSDSQSLGSSSDHTHSDRWTSWSAVVNDITPDRFLRAQDPRITRLVSQTIYMQMEVSHSWKRRRSKRGSKREIISRNRGSQ